MEHCDSYLFLVICGSIYVCSAHVWKFWLVEKSRLLKSSFCGELEWDAPLAYHGSIELSQLMLLLYLILFMFLLEYSELKFAELVASSIYFKMAILCKHMKLQELGGNSWWFDRFLAQHIAFFYYIMTVLMYAISPRMACKYKHLCFLLHNSLASLCFLHPRSLLVKLSWMFIWTSCLPLFTTNVRKPVQKLWP